MKKLLGIVVLGLLWCNAGYATDELKKYQIGDYTYGESLLKYHPKNQIDKYKSCQLPGGDRFCSLTMLKNETTDIYDSIQFIFDQNDSNYKIHSLLGSINYQKWSECVDEQTTVVNFYNSRFKDLIRITMDERNVLKTYLEKPNFVSDITFFFKGGGAGKIGCYSVSRETFIKYGYNPKPTNIYMTMSISSKDFVEFHDQPGTTKEYIKKKN